MTAAKPKKLDAFKSLPLVKKIGFNRVILIGVIFALYGLFALLSPILHNGTSFVNYARIMSALNYCYFIGFLGLGVTFVIATGGIDFSIGSVMFCAALISGYCLTKYNVPLPVCLLMSVLIGTLFGTIGGFFVAYIHLPSFITSMALMLVAKGVGSIFTKTQSVSWPNLSSGQNVWFRYLVKWGDVPTGLFLLLLFAVICGVILTKTRAGRYMICLGSNKEAVRLSGVDVRRWEMLAYVISGTMAGLAAIFYVGAYTTVQPGLGDTFNNDAIAACVMGGTSMAGGSASILGTIIGAIIVALVQEGILAMGFNINYQYVLTGLIVLVAVTADTLSRKRKN
ncbi:MAG: ABC transporter permease [Clostridiales bacterium]|nr:ABC transporter permease [Clostridiales bacterium]MDY2836253.1 ABC transporter permease [Candidatus Aphodomonas sp.]